MNLFYEYLSHTPSFDKVVKINFSGNWSNSFYTSMAEDVDAHIGISVDFGFGRLNINEIEEFFYCVDDDTEFHNNPDDTHLEYWEQYIKGKENFKGSQLPEVELKDPRYFKMFDGNKWLNVTLDGFNDDETKTFLEEFLSRDFKGKTITFKNIITSEEFQIEVPQLEYKIKPIHK